MSTKNDQKILIRSISRDTAIKYMIDSDLDGKIEKNDEYVWHLYSKSQFVNNEKNLVSFLTNDTLQSNCLYFGVLYGIDRIIYMTQLKEFPKKLTNIENIGYNPPSKFLGVINTGTKKNQNSNYYLYNYPVFRPMFEYKE